MTDPFYISRANIRKTDQRHHRTAELEGGPTLDMGVHGAAKEHYKLVDAKDLPLPVDYIVAATGG